VWIIELASVTNAGDVVPAALRLRLRDRALLETVPNARDAPRNWSRPWWGRARLLIVDNCEHLIDAAAEPGRHAAGRLSKLRIIATSGSR